MANENPLYAVRKLQRAIRSVRQLEKKAGSPVLFDFVDTATVSAVRNSFSRIEWELESHRRRLEAYFLKKKVRILVLCFAEGGADCKIDRASLTLSCSDGRGDNLLEAYQGTAWGALAEQVAEDVFQLGDRYLEDEFPRASLIAKVRHVARDFKSYSEFRDDLPPAPVKPYKVDWLPFRFLFR